MWKLIEGILIELSFFFYDSTNNFNLLSHLIAQIILILLFPEKKRFSDIFPSETKNSRPNFTYIKRPNKNQPSGPFYLSVLFLSLSIFRKIIGSRVFYILHKRKRKERWGKGKKKRRKMKQVWQMSLVFLFPRQYGFNSRDVPRRRRIRRDFTFFFFSC